ncbi:MAG: 2TM domain-containing protein [Acidimicrobiia bacterium]|nr:2TM domain-containing protein [Acidimicrobiia bacterium]
MDREELEQRRFSQEEVGELIETATRLDGLVGDRGLTLEELRNVAAELGISDDALLEALETRLRGERAEKEEQEAAEATTAALADTRRAQVNEWKQHTAAFLGVNGGLAILDLVTGGGFEWFFYATAAWGIGYLIHSLLVLFRTAE